MLMLKAALCLYSRWVPHGNVKRCIFKPTPSEGAICTWRGRGREEDRERDGRVGGGKPVWTWPNVNSETDYIASRAVMI